MSKKSLQTRIVHTDYTAPGGFAAIEIGHDQADSAAALFAEAGHDVRLSHDLAGRARALLI